MVVLDETGAHTGSSHSLVQRGDDTMRRATRDSSVQPPYLGTPLLQGHSYQKLPYSQ